MAQLPCIGLSWPLTKPPFGSCAIYFHYGVIFFGWQEIPNWFPACFQVAALLPCTLSLRHLHVAKISSWKKSGNLWELLNRLDLGIQLIEALLASFQTHQTCIAVSPFMSCRLYLSISAFP